jgi:hypothetical protein
MMMEHGFSDEMNAQEELSNRQSAHANEGWMGRIKGAMAADEKAEPFQFKPQVTLLCSLFTDSPWFD